MPKGYGDSLAFTHYLLFLISEIVCRMTRVPYSRSTVGLGKGGQYSGDNKKETVSNSLPEEREGTKHPLSILLFSLIATLEGEGADSQRKGRIEMGIADNNWWETRVWRGKGTNLNGSIDDLWSLIFTSCSSWPFSSWHVWESYSVVPPSARLSLPSYAPDDERSLFLAFRYRFLITHS